MVAWRSPPEKIDSACQYVGAGVIWRSQTIHSFVRSIIQPYSQRGLFKYMISSRRAGEHFEDMPAMIVQRERDRGRELRDDTRLAKVALRLLLNYC
jgi:hypothetical protein